KFEFEKGNIEEFLNDFILKIPREFLNLSTRELLLQVKVVMCCSKKARSCFTENKMMTVGDLITTAKTLRLFNKKDEYDQNERGRRGVKCFNCNQDGHRKFECPRLEGGKSSRNESDVKGVKKLAYRSFDNKEKMVVMDKKPVKIEVNGVSVAYEGVLDTRADITVVPRKLWEKLEKPSAYQLGVQIYGVGGTRIPVVGFINVCMKGPLGQVEDLRCVVMDEEELLIDPETFVQLYGSLEMACKEVLTQIKTGYLSVNNYLEAHPEIYDDSIPKKKSIEVDYVVKEDPLIRKVFRPRKMEPTLRELTRKFVEKEIKNGNMERVEFPKQACPVTAVPKKNGEIRLCIDGSFINSNFTHIPLELPSMLDLQKFISDFPEKDKLVFSLVDCKSAYRLIKVSEKSNEWTTMALDFGYFKSNCLVYGLSQSGVLFYNSLKKVLSGLSFLMIFMDDILVLHQEKDEQPLIEVLERLRLANLKINKDKLLVGEKVVEYTGFEISREGIRATTEAIKSTLEISVPEERKDLLSLKGKISRLRNFIGEDCSEYERKIMDKESIWSEEKEKLWKSIKLKLINRQLLEYYDQEKEKLILEVGWTQEAVKFTLWGEPRAEKNSKERYVKKKLINLGSKVLSECEKNYSTIEKSALAVRLGLEKFSGFTKMILTEVRTIDASLKIDETFSSMTYIPQVKKVNVCQLDVPINISGIEDEEYESLKKKIINKLPLTTNYEKSFVSSYNGLEVKDEIITIFGRPLLPKKAYSEISEWAHEGHYSVENMLRKIRSIFMAPGIRKHLVEIYEKCHICQVTGRRRNYRIMEWSPTNGENQRWHMDVGQILNTLILVVVDTNSNFIMAEKIGKQDSIEIVKALKKIFSRNGVPQILVSDNYKSFTSTTVKNYCARRGTTQIFTVPYESYTNGPAEQAVKTIKKGLEKLSKENNNSINENLDAVLITHHSNTFNTEGKTPLERRIGTADNYSFREAYLYAEKFENKPVYYKPALSKEWKLGNLVERLSEHVYIVEDTETHHHMMVKEDQWKDRKVQQMESSSWGEVNTNCLLTIGQPWDKDQQYLWHRMSIIEDMSTLDPLSGGGKKWKIAEVVENLKENRVICAVDGSNAPVGFSVVVAVKLGKKFCWLVGYASGKKFCHLEKDLTHMDMETEALLLALTLVKGADIQILCDSKSAVSSVKAWSRNTTFTKLRQKKLRNLARKIPEEDFNKIKWLPRNCIAIMEKADLYSHGVETQFQ
uniref:RNA-directed DNA polymerase n=1 Tax=Strongyloides stercoralis TaxID=6248 RepID=A0AAF5DPI9_STRER